MEKNHSWNLSRSILFWKIPFNTFLKNSWTNARVELIAPTTKLQLIGNKKYRNSASQSHIDARISYYVWIDGRCRVWVYNLKIGIASKPWKWPTTVRRFGIACLNANLFLSSHVCLHQYFLLYTLQLQLGVCMCGSVRLKNQNNWFFSL